MDTEFYKLHCGGAAWILLDGRGRQPPDPSNLARQLCHPRTGAAASGLLLLEGNNLRTLRCWLANGDRIHAPVAARLCAARWIFDNGFSEGDTIHLAATDRDQTVFALDPRVFSTCALTDAEFAELRLPRIPERLPELRQHPAYLASWLPGSSELPGGAQAWIRSQENLHFWDGPIAKPASPPPGCHIAIISRSAVRLAGRPADPFRTAALCARILQVWGYCDQSLALTSRKQDLLVQNGPDGAVYAAAGVDYCFSGKFWLDEALPPQVK